MRCWACFRCKRRTIEINAVYELRTRSNTTIRVVITSTNLTCDTDDLSHPCDDGVLNTEQNQLT